MKRSTLLPLLLFWAATGIYAQQKVFSHQSQRELSVRPNHSVIQMDESNSFIFSLADKKRMLRFYCSKSGNLKLLEQKTEDAFSDEGFKYYSVIDPKILKLYWQNPVIGGVYKDREILEVIRSDFNSDFYFIKTNLATGSIVFTDTVPTNYAEKIISCFNENNRLYLLTYINNSNDLIVYTKEPSSALKKMVKTIDIGDLGKNANSFFLGRINKLSEIFERNEFAIYRNNQRYPAIVTPYRDKAYYLRKKIIFTVSSNNLNTYAISLDLESLQHSIQSFDQDMENGDNNSNRTCSYLVNNKLLTCHLSNKNLLLNIFDFNSGKVLKSINITADNIDSLMTGSVEKTGSFISKSDISQENFRRFITAAKNNQLSISAYEENKKLYISFAAPYRQLINGTTLLNIALSTTGTIGINSTPNYYGYLLYSYPGVRSSTFVSFDITLDTEKFQSVKQPPNCTVWDNISIFLETHGREKNRPVFFMNGFYYIGDYLPDIKTYSIYSFDESRVY